MRVRFGFCLLALVFGLQPLRAGAEDPVGVVRTLRGSATIIRLGRELPLSPGFRVMEGDVVRTGPDSAVGIFLRDDASLALGPKTELALERFRFSPATNEYSFITRIMKGTICYLSGLIGKLSPESARFETPAATLSIRGTRFAASVHE